MFDRLAVLNSTLKTPERLNQTRCQHFKPQIPKDIKQSNDFLKSLADLKKSGATNKKTRSSAPRALMLVLRVPAFRPLEFRLLFFCGRHVSPRSTQLRQLRAQVPGVIRELLDVADGLKLRLPGGWSLVQMDPRESQALPHLRRHRRRCRRQRPLINRLPRLIINSSPSSSGRACAVTCASE